MRSDVLTHGFNKKDHKMSLLTKPMLLIPLLAVLATAGCETFKGAGRDIQDVGGAVTSTAAQVENDL